MMWRLGGVGRLGLRERLGLGVAGVVSVAGAVGRVASWTSSWPGSMTKRSSPKKTRKTWRLM